MVAADVDKYSDVLYARERWLVLNKMDLIPAEEFAEKRAAMLEVLD